MRFFKSATAIFLILVACVFMGFAQETDGTSEEVEEQQNASSAGISLSGDKALEYEKPVHDPYNSAVSRPQKPDIEPDPVASDEVISLASEDAKGYYNRGEAYYARHAYDKAIKDFSQAINLNPKYTEAYILSGKSYYAKAEKDTQNNKEEYYRSAIDDFDKAVIISPRNAEAYNGLGVVYAAEGKWALAIENFTKAIRFDPTVPEDPSIDNNYKERGFAYLANNENTRAIQDFERLIKDPEKPNDPKVYSGRGFAYLARGIDSTDYEKAKPDFNKAIQDFTEAIKRLPRINNERVNAYNGRGLAYFKLKEFDNAIKDFSRAFDVDPVNFYAYYGRGLSAFERKDYGRAKKDFEKAIDIDPTYSYAYNALAQVHDAMGDSDKAKSVRAELEQKLNPGNQEQASVKEPYQPPTFTSETAQLEKESLKKSFQSAQQ